VHAQEFSSNEELIAEIDEVHSAVSAAQRRLFDLIADGDKREVWQESGARDMAHWVSMRYGVSQWKALRWIAAAHALEALPAICEAFSSGQLGIDKVVELTRFATPETESLLVRWAMGVSAGCIRHKGDLAVRLSLAEIQEAEVGRSLSWWYFDEGRRFGLSAELPAAQGAVVARALERLGEQLPVMPGEDGPWATEARRADALVALASVRIGVDADPDRATVVIHAQVGGRDAGEGGYEIEDGPVIHPETAKRLLCNARVQVVVEDLAAQPLHLGRMTREPPAWMVRQLRHRDRECWFPRCGARAFTQAHHIVWWNRGGTTDLDNLVLVCTFHHKLVHEFGWRIKLDGDGTVSWFRPNGKCYRAGPDPPRRTDRTSLVVTRSLE
jgi:hypothetical protein